LTICLINDLSPCNYIGNSGTNIIWANSLPQLMANLPVILNGIWTIQTQCLWDISSALADFSKSIHLFNDVSNPISWSMYGKSPYNPYGIPINIVLLLNSLILFNYSNDDDPPNTIN